LEDKSLSSKNYSDYSPTHDRFLKDIYKKEEKWKVELKKKMALNNSWSNNSSVNVSSSSIITSSQNSLFTVNGSTNKVEVKAALEVNGRDILKELDEMRDALLLLKRDINMEDKYPRLKEIKDEYERELSKYKTFDAIKESN
jgi:hypothetical protein